MRTAEALLLAAVRAAPRRYRLPPLPADAASAWAAGPETALAFAIEAARTGQDERALFSRALAALIRAALEPQGGDPTFQVLVLRARDPVVDEHVRLAARATGDARCVRAAVNAIAHPGKTRSLPAGPQRDALETLYRLAQEGAWSDLRSASQPGQVDDAVLARLARAGALQAHPGVLQYRALCEQRGPLAGSQAATAQGNASAKLGLDAEQATLHAFGEIARILDAAAAASGRYRAVGSLRTPRGFPGAADKAKDEWDAAIVHVQEDAGADVLLLAEVKASPAAATPDFSRLLRGLQRLADAEAGVRYAFPTAEGELHVTGESLRRLRPGQDGMPAQVIYCCSSTEARPAMLSAATRAVLLAEPASVAFAGHADAAVLGALWDALTTAPRLRSALHQYQTAMAVREAMLHPDDLLAAVRARSR